MRIVEESCGVRVLFPPKARKYIFRRSRRNRLFREGGASFFAEALCQENPTKCRSRKYARFGRSLFSQFSHERQRDMEEEYDTDAFVIFVIAMISIYIVFASWFLFRRIRRLFNKEPSVRIMHMK